MHNDNSLDVSPNPFHRFQQIILIKRSRDFLANPQIDRLFHTLCVHHLVFFGAVAEWCVRPAVMSLLHRGQRVGVVTDACGAWSAADADLAMRKMDAKGAVLVTTDELLSGAADERLRSTSSAFEPEEQEPIAAGPERHAEPFCWP